MHRKVMPLLLRALASQTQHLSTKSLDLQCMLFFSVSVRPFNLRRLRNCFPTLFARTCSFESLLRIQPYMTTQSLSRPDALELLAMADAGTGRLCGTVGLGTFAAAAEGAG